MSDTASDRTSSTWTRQEARQDDELRRRIGSAGDVTVRLTDDSGDDGGSAASDHDHGHSARLWDGLAAALVAGDDRVSTEKPYAVLGGPGTGKSSLLVDTVVDFLRCGGRAEDVMVVTASKEAATALREHSPRFCAPMTTTQRRELPCVPSTPGHSRCFAPSPRKTPTVPQPCHG
jgi:hypothetical protein